MFYRVTAIVCEKVFLEVEKVLPAVTNLDSFRSISVEADCSWTITTTKHFSPNIIESRRAHSMRHTALKSGIVIGIFVRKKCRKYHLNLVRLRNHTFF